MSLRARLGSVASTVYPSLDERLWNRQRDRSLPRSRYRKTHPELLGRPTKLLVVPQEGRDFDSWRPGTQNIYFEAWQTAVDLMGTDRVDVFHVPPGETAALWISRLVNHAKEFQATHIITHIESDPGSESSTWNWDLAWAELLRNWDGVLLGVMFDSAYKWLTAQSRRLARMSSRFMLVDICMPMDDVLIRGRREVGPVNMPVSETSLRLLNERLRDVHYSWDVSFIGVLYPYRVELLDKVRAQGVDVVVNPHRNDGAADYLGTRVNRPGWLDYMAALAESRMTINFSQSNAAPVQQLKTRVIEAMLAGTVLLTDDVDRTERFFRPGVDYLTFTSLEELPDVISEALMHPDRLKVMAENARDRAEGLALRGLWDAIEDGLNRRGLPALQA